MITRSFTINGPGKCREAVVPRPLNHPFESGSKPAPPDDSHADNIDDTPQELTEEENAQAEIHEQMSQKLAGLTMSILIDLELLEPDQPAPSKTRDKLATFSEIQRERLLTRFSATISATMNGTVRAFDRAVRRYVGAEGLRVRDVDRVAELYMDVLDSIEALCSLDERGLKSDHRYELVEEVWRAIAQIDIAANQIIAKNRPPSVWARVVEAVSKLFRRDGSRR